MQDTCFLLFIITLGILFYGNMDGLYSSLKSAEQGKVRFFCPHSRLEDLVPRDRLGCSVLRYGTYTKTHANRDMI